MISALWRKLRADVKTHKLQFALIWGVLTLSAMLLTVSLLVMGSANDPWERTFEATHGPHLWLVSSYYDLNFSPLTRNPAVTESTGAILSLAENPLVLGDEKQSIFLYAMDEPPQVAHPLVTNGRWLEPANPDEIVLDFSLAKFYGFQVGDTVTVLGADGNHTLQVVGLAVTAHWFPFDEITKDVSPGVAYISQETLESLQPDPKSWYAAIGVRIKEPADSKDMADLAIDLFPGELRSVIEWQFVKENATLANTLNAMFMGLFSMLGLAAVGMIIFNTIGGQVLSQYREIGLLKAVGFTPRQVTLLFLGEHLAVGLVAALLGVLFGLAVAPNFVGVMARNLNTTPPDIYTPGPLIGVVLLVEAAVALATLLPAWQGGRIDTVQALTVGYRSPRQRVSRLGRLAGWLRLPVVIVLGVKDTFSRPLRTILAVASLLLTILVAITAIGAQYTVLHLANNRVYLNGTSADMKVVRNFVPKTFIKSKILSRSEVTDYYEEALIYGQAPGHSDQPMAVRLLQGNYQDFDFAIKEGRMIAAHGEAVAGYEALELLEAQVGDTAQMLVDGKPVEVTIVGRYAENFMLNKVVITSLKTYVRQTRRNTKPTTYYLRLRDPGMAEDLRREWLDQSQGLINVSVINTQPAASMVQLKNLIAGLAAILMLVAAANLMSASLLSIREQVRDFGIQKTLGVTPAQIAASVVVGTVAIALIALLLGVTLGMVVMVRFIQQVGIAIGAGTDFYIINWGAISLLLPILVLVAALSSLLPALRAARLEVNEALRYE
ncbi:MAG: FtsX-like permease family protein [Chloroflexota bacterium]